MNVRGMNPNMQPRCLMRPDDGEGGGGGGGGETKTYDVTDETPIPESWREDPLYKDIKTFGGLKGSYLNAQKMIGSSRLPMPKDDAPQEEWDKFYNSTGRPAEAKEYNFKDVKYPEGVQPHEKMQEWFRGHSHKLGLSQKQSQGVFQGFNDFLGEIGKAEKQAMSTKLVEWEETNKNNLGAAYQEAMDIKGRVLREHGDEELSNVLKSSMLEKHPAMIRFLHNVGKAMGEHRVDNSNDENNKFMVTPDQAIREVNAMKLDKDFMKVYTNTREPGHKEAVQKMNDLYKLAYPQKREE